MAVPQYDELMNPMIKALKILGGTAHIRDIEFEVAKILNLSQDDVSDIHRGTTTKLVYRLAWSRNYLKRFGILRNIERGVWTLTEDGKKIDGINIEEVKSKVKSYDNSVDEKDVEDDIIQVEDSGSDSDRVEKEEIDPSARLMDKPFDPTLINIDTKTPSLDTLIERISQPNPEIELNTESYFQRKDDLWNVEKQSRLIESILIRFPLPAFYFDGSDNNKWLVVDGLQRLSSIRNFVVKKNLKLTNLEFLTQLNGKSYDDLDRDLKRIIKETQVVIYIINPGTPIDVKFNIFKRINTGGLVLEPQEIRHALFQGEPAKFVAELANVVEFKKATTYSINPERMLDRDFATRFLAFYLFGYQGYTPDLDTFMSKAMAAVNNFSSAEKQKVKTDFIASMNLNIAIFGGNAFRKYNDTDRKRKPINKALFDVFSVLFAKLTPEERAKLFTNKDLLAHLVPTMLEDPYFMQSVTSSTSNKDRVNYRFSKIEEVIQNLITVL